MDNMEKFRALLKKAQGNRTQIQFAKDAGMPVETLNRMMAGTSASKPRQATLDKIAESSGGRVTLGEMFDLFGYDLAGYIVQKEKKRADTPGRERAKKEVCELVDGLSSLRGQKWKNVEDITETLAMLWSVEHTELSAGEEMPCPARIDQNAENMRLVKGRCPLSGSGETAELYILFTYSRTVGGAVIPSMASASAGVLKKAGMLPEWALGAGLQDGQDFFVISNDNGMSEEEAEAIRKNLERLTGPDGDKYISTLTGIGFEVPDGPPDAVVEAFRDAHKGSIRKYDMEDIGKYLAGDKDAFMNSGDRETGNFGWGAVVANAIRKETGLPLGFWTQNDGWRDFKFKNNPPCIIVYDDEIARRGLKATEVMDVLEPYARKLGAEAIKTVYFQAVFDKEKGEYRYLGKKGERA